MPRMIISDRDPRFTSRFWKSLLKILGTMLSFSTVFHLQTDGQTERVNRVVEEMLRNYINYKTDDWSSWLATAEFAYNNSTHSSTSVSPFEAIYGVRPRTPATLSFEEGTPIASEELSKELERMQAIASDSIKEPQVSQAYYVNNRRRLEEFDVGEKVLLSTRNIRMHPKKASKKFQNAFIGPYEIIKKIS